jgi:hypothetical protein
VVFNDVFERVLKILENETFEFVLNDETVKSRIAEAVMISPIVYDRLRAVRDNFIFHISGSTMIASQLNICSFH